MTQSSTTLSIEQASNELAIATQYMRKAATKAREAHKRMVEAQGMVSEAEKKIWDLKKEGASAKEG